MMKAKGVIAAQPEQTTGTYGTTDLSPRLNGMLCSMAVARNCAHLQTGQLHVTDSNSSRISRYSANSSSTSPAVSGSPLA